MYKFASSFLPYLLVAILIYLSWATSPSYLRAVKKIAIFGAGRSTHYLFSYLNRLIANGHALTVKVYEGKEQAA